MLEALFQGILVGFTLAIMIGPAFFTLVQTSIERGFKRAVILAFGISLSDLTLVILTYLGIVQILNTSHSRLFFGLVGGLILISFGVYTFMKKSATVEGKKVREIKIPGLHTYVLKGFFLNIANPFVWIFWITLTVGAGSRFHVESNAMFVFLGGLLGTVLSTDILKCLIAHQIKRILTPTIMHIINIIVGILLAAFGIVLIFRVVFENKHLLKSFF